MSRRGSAVRTAGLFDKFYLDTLKKGTMPSPLIDGFAILDENGVQVVDENDVPRIYGETVLVRRPRPAGAVAD